MPQETDRFPELIRWFSRNGSRVIVALSGGVDSAVVALAAKRADEAYHIGPSAASESYLNTKKIIETATTGQESEPWRNVM